MECQKLLVGLLLLLSYAIMSANGQEAQSNVTADGERSSKCECNIRLLKSN